MEWTAVTSILLVFLLGPLALAGAALILLPVGRLVLRGQLWQGLSGWCEGCAAGCARSWDSAE